jgi:hypothetical protein
MREALGYKLSLITLNGTINMCFSFKDLMTTNHTMMYRVRSNIPSIFLFKACISSFIVESHDGCLLANLKSKCSSKVNRT